MMTSRKEYNFNNGFGIVCTTFQDYFGNMIYVVEAIMLCVPWQEVCDRLTAYDKDTANANFIALRDKYKRIGR